jgi:hypothetical protein
VETQPGETTDPAATCCVPNASRCGPSSPRNDPGRGHGKPGQRGTAVLWNLISSPFGGGFSINRIESRCWGQGLSRLAGVRTSILVHRHATPGVLGLIAMRRLGICRDCHSADSKAVRSGRT